MAVNIIKHTSNIREPVWSPVASKIVFRDYYENLYTVDLDGSTPKNLINDGGIAQWSPDGLFVYYLSLSGNQIGKINVNTLKSEIIYQAQDIHQFALSRSGTSLVISHKDRLVIAETDGSNVRIIVDSTSSWEFPDYENLSWSFDDTWVVTAANIERSYHVVAVNPYTRNKKIIYKKGYKPTCNPVNSLVALINDLIEPKSICLWDLTTEHLQIVELENHLMKSQSISGHFSWSTNGKLIAFVRQEKGGFISNYKHKENALCLLSVMDGKVTKIMKLHDGMGQETFSSPAWSPDNKMIVVTLSPDFALHVITL